jgi:hypothetical protein
MIVIIILACDIGTYVRDRAADPGNRREQFHRIRVEGADCPGIPAPVRVPLTRSANPERGVWGRCYQAARLAMDTRGSENGWGAILPSTGTWPPYGLVSDSPDINWLSGL